MRVLGSFTGGPGHLLPLLPFLRALRARGHRVEVTGQEAMLPAIRRSGFTGHDSGGPTLLPAAERRPLAPIDRAAEQAVIRDVFAGSLARERAHRLTGILDRVRPDVVVRDEMDLGAAAAAERAGIPQVSVTVLLSGGFATPDLLRPGWSALRRELDLPPDPALARVSPTLTLVPFPAAFRDPADPPPASARSCRPEVLEPWPSEPDPPAVAWLRQRPGRPVVYVSLGTVFPQEAGDLFSRVLAGLVPLDASIVVTVGRELDPAELGPQPAHVRVERFVPARQLLPHCTAMVSHAGSGSIAGCLALGAPLVLVPMGADQPWNADRCAALGVARVLDPVASSPADFREAVRDVLTAPAWAVAAARWRQACAALPTIARAAGWIEQAASAARLDGP